MQAYTEDELQPESRMADLLTCLSAVKASRLRSVCRRTRALRDCFELVWHVAG